jgi:hypothetical protein
MIRAGNGDTNRIASARIARNRNAVPSRVVD